MYRISLDAAGWRTTDDFYTDLLSALKAPAWHGRNLDALWDTLTERARFDDLTDFINGIPPPFRVDVRNVQLASEPVKAFLPRIEHLFALANSEYALGVSIIFDDLEVVTDATGEPPDNSPS